MTWRMTNRSRCRSGGWRWRPGSRDWRAARAIRGGEDAVFLALTDTQRRFGISDELLEDLVRGTTLDLEERQPGVEIVSVTTELDEAPVTEEFQVYESFDALYRYCYLVASVVGLVCIKVFGYTDPRAEKLGRADGGWRFS